MSTTEWRPGERREIQRHIKMLWGTVLDEKKREEMLSQLAASGLPYERVRTAMTALSRRPPTASEILLEAHEHERAAKVRS